MENEIAFASMIGRAANLSENNGVVTVNDAEFVSVAQSTYGSDVEIVLSGQTSQRTGNHVRLFLNESGNVYDIC